MLEKRIGDSYNIGRLEEKILSIEKLLEVLHKKLSDYNNSVTGWEGKIEERISKLDIELTARVVKIENWKAYWKGAAAPVGMLVAIGGGIIGYFISKLL